MKYIKKPVVVEAEVYKPGMETCVCKVHLSNAIAKTWFPLETPWDFSGQVNEYGEVLVPHLEGGISGRKLQPLKPDSYIVTDPKGKRFVIHKEEFQSNYELVGEG